MKARNSAGLSPRSSYANAPERVGVDSLHGASKESDAPCSRTNEAQEHPHSSGPPGAVGPALTILVVGARGIYLGYRWNGAAAKYGWPTPYAASMTNDMAGRDDGQAFRIGSNLRH